jgi:hypothetical protein
MTLPSKNRQRVFRVGDRVRSKLNRRVGNVDAVEKIQGRRRYGLHYDEAPQDRYISYAGRDGASLPPELIERV